MLLLAFRNLTRRPLRNGLTIAGLAIAVAVLTCLSAFAHGYRQALQAELERMGLQLMLVPLGCPYDAAARVLKGRALENSLPESAVEAARSDPDVAIAAPLLMAALPRPAEGRADLWVGLDEAAIPLKPWWHAAAGENWFTGENSVLLGCDAAEIEMRAPGDSFYSPETGANFRVAGVLARSGTSDDSLFFVPLRTAQKMFHQPGRLTAIAIRLRDPARLHEVAARLQNIPGAQIATLAEMMGTFLNLVGAVRTLSFSIGCIAVTISLLAVFNTLLAAVVERSGELSVMRAIGASRSQIFRLMTTEALLLTITGSLAGIILAWIAGAGIEQVVKQFVPLAPAESILSPPVAIVVKTLALGIAIGLLGGLYPAWRAGRLQPADALKVE
jgi:putative ABC transport system permease protein